MVDKQAPAIKPEMLSLFCTTLDQQFILYMTGIASLPTR